MGAMRYWRAVGIGVVLLGVASAAFGDTVDDFIKEVDSRYYREDFSSYTYDDLGADFSGNGFEYRAFASQGLFPLDDALSINSAMDVLKITFTGVMPVTAVGGDFLVTDTDGNPLSGIIAIALNDGSPAEFACPDSTFIGFLSKDPIMQMTVWIPSMMEVPGQPADDGTGHQYPALDRFYVGRVISPQPPLPAVVPLPAAGWAGLMLIGGLGAVKLAKQGGLGN